MMNHQAPTSKHQRNSKRQTRKGAKARTAAFKYLVVAEQPLVLNETPNGQGTSKHPFDLEERTARFGEAIVRFSKKISRSPTNDRLIDQLVGCGTSIGGNYCEANEGISEKGFSPHDFSLRKGIKGNEILSSNACRCRTAACRRSARTLSRGKGVASDFREHFSEN
jgi:hypothetical protein